METTFASQVQELNQKADLVISSFIQAKRNYGEQAKLSIPPEFEAEFFSLVDQVNLSLMEDGDHFFGYFLLQMSKEIRFDISSPTAVNFKGAKYIIYFNPIIFLDLTLLQMESTIKHEILHIISLHLIRAKEFKGTHSKTAINMAMNIVVNTFLEDLPPYSVTLKWVNLNYSLQLLPFKTFEYYVEELQTALDLLAVDEESRDESDLEEDEDRHDTEAADYQLINAIATAYDPAKTHDLWEDSSEIDAKTLQEFTEQYIAQAQKGSIPNYLENLISSFKNNKGELPWNLYLKRLMGSVESNNKKTVTRRNRRQPQRLDLRGQLRSHKANIIVALDISGSISDLEFNQAVQEVLAIVRNYHHEITIVECDSEIRRVYTIKSAKDIKERINTRGGTRFTPVFEYANEHKVNLLIYFTDGRGEEKLQTLPKGYKTLWVISGRGDELSLQVPYGVVKRLMKVDAKDDSVSMSDVKRDGYSMQDQER
ncbi:VWA-like domain-containing protein [Desulfitobacterium sp. THU1]|uniref:vWA domain-containing protein n=1 Tax=Desulfitobacterium sp. THU1 TaxID=3138072 RepID=UPI00311EE4DC